MLTQPFQPTVLIIDDTSHDREAYRRYLIGERDYRYQILEEESAEGALELCQTWQRDRCSTIDAILLDYQLPDKDGLEFLIELKATIGEDCPPVILITGQGSEAIAVQAFKQGVDDYLVKDKITPESLRCTTRIAIENGQLRRKLRESEARYRAIVDTQMELICRFLPDGTLTFVNTAYCRFFDTTVDRLVGKNLLEYIPASSLELVQQQIAEFSHLTPDAPVITHEHPVLKPNGEIGWQQWTNRALFDGEGRLVEVQAVGRDISDQVRIEGERQQIAQQLEDSQRFLQQVAETVPGILYVYDLVDRCNVFVNRNVAEVLGYTPAQIQAMGSDLIPTLIHPDDLDRIPEHVDQFETAPDGTVFELEYRMQHSSGEWRWFCGRETVFERTPDGQVKQILGIADDITQRKSAELALRQANERFELVTAAVNGLIYDYDLQCNRVTRSAGLTTLFGYSLDEAEPTAQWWHNLIHPEDAAQINWDEVQEQLAILDRVAGEYRVRHKNGHYVWVEERSFVIRNDAGEPVRMVGCTTDISDRKQQEAAICERESLFRGIFESNLTGILLWNSNGQITDANDAFVQMTGYRREEMQAGQLYYQDITPPEYHAIDAEKFERMQRTGQFSPVEKEYICKDGSRIPILLGCAFLPGSTDRGVAFVLNIRDRKQFEQEREQLLAQTQAAKEEAEQANRSKDEFLAIVSHELRSPLNAILGWASILRSKQLPPDKVEQALATIERNARSQNQLIEDLLDVSRMIRGTLCLTMAPVNLVNVVETTIQNVQLSAEAKQITLRSRLDRSIGTMMGDENRLRQVVTNLLTNAIKFTPNGGQVDVELSISRSMINLIVRDNGKGIAPDFLPYVFEQFTQAGARSKEGLGLGLAIVRHLVERHGGTVTAESSGVGQGATFTVSLPVRSQFMRDSNSSDAATLAGVRVLAVDDELDSLNFVQFALEAEGAEVAIALSAQEAIEQFEQFQPNLVISDIGMPEQDGYWLIQTLRTLNSEFTAIALTAYAKLEDRDRALSAGFQVHLAKPIDPDELITTILRELAGNFARR